MVIHVIFGFRVHAAVVDPEPRFGVERPSYLEKLRRGPAHKSDILLDGSTLDCKVYGVAS